MLIMTRKASEEIRIGDNIVLTVVSVSGERVRLGITADKSIAILRDNAKVRVRREQFADTDQFPASHDFSEPQQ